MSGIAGIFYTDRRPVREETPQAMADAMPHRARDGSATWRMGAVGLAHCMLHTTPESLGERLPFYDAERRLAITADARLDNREELISALGLKQPAKELPDSRLILEAYARWGEDCLPKLLGDFAFALWDGGREVLFCARDPFGIKPFYYYHEAGKLFAFASEIKGILASGEASRQLDEVRILDHLLPLMHDKRNTIYRDIFRLPAAHSLKLSERGITIRRYWEPDLTRELRLRSDGEYEEAFREALTRAVQSRLRSAYPVGSMLSGGLDSSSIACLARNLLAQDGSGPFPTFSAIFPSRVPVDKRIEERPYIEKTLASGGFDAHFIHADEISPLIDLKEVHWLLDEPLSAGNLYMDWGVFRAASQQGVRVLFSGVDGDSTVGYGYEDFPEYIRRGWWGSLWREAEAHCTLWHELGFSPKRLVWNYGVRPLIPGSWRRAWRKFRGFPEVDASPWANRLPPLSAAFNARLSLEQRLAALEAAEPSWKYQPRLEHWEGINSGLFAYCLEGLDKIGAHFGLEPRYPFFDRRLVEFCLAVPPGQRMREGWARSILRRSMEGILPDAVRWRVSKGDLSSNFALGLLEKEQPLLDTVTAAEGGVLSEFVDRDVLRELYGRYTAEPLRRAHDGWSVMRAVTLDVWLRSLESARGV